MKNRYINLKNSDIIYKLSCRYYVGLQDRHRINARKEFIDLCINFIVKFDIVK